MASLQDIRHRIKSVKSTKQITSAMNMVATSRLRHAKEAATANRPYAQKVSEVVHAIAKNAGTDFSHPLLEKHEDGKKLVFLITSDKGLAGAYSSNACKAA
ncbi:F0F1 ATP synthase subunit gamma, partial [Mitsuokella jalaludinii]